MKDRDIDIFEKYPNATKCLSKKKLSEVLGLSKNAISKDFVKKSIRKDLEVLLSNLEENIRKVKEAH